MKVLVLTQNIKNISVLGNGLSMVKELLKQVPLDIEFTFVPTTKQFSSVPFSNDVNNSGFIVDPAQIFSEGKSTGVPFDSVLLVYDWTKIIPQPSNPANNGMMMQIPENWYNVYPEVFAEFYLHELCHYFYQGQGKLDRTHEYNSEFSQKPRVAWYLHLLKELVPQQVSTPQPMTTYKYKYFNPKSDPKMIGVKHEVMLKLDLLREKCGFPISITSGVRTKAQNDSLPNASKNSGHLRGYEVDILATDSAKRDKIIRLSYEVGFTRRGIGENFVHLGIDPSLAQNVMWTYY